MKEKTQTVTRRGILKKKKFKNVDRHWVFVFIFMPCPCWIRVNQVFPPNPEMLDQLCGWSPLPKSNCP